MIESHVYWSLVGARWVMPENFARGPAHFFDDAPEHLRAKLREDAQAAVAHNYRLSGIGRHPPEEALELSTRSLSALSALLAGKLYLMGNQPCGTDATAFGALAGVLTTFFDSPLRRCAMEFTDLADYVDRMMLLFYPEHVWQPIRQAA